MAIPFIRSKLPLDIPNHCRHPTLWLHDLCLGVLTVHGTELRIFGVKAFPLLVLLMSCIWHCSSRYYFSRLSLWRGSGRASNPLPSQATPSRCATFYATDSFFSKYNFIVKTQKAVQKHFVYFPRQIYTQNQMYIFN